MNLSTNTVQLFSKLQWNFENGDINQKSRLFANWTVLPFETCWLQRWGTSSTLNAINLVTSEYLQTNKNNGQQRQVFGLYDFYPVTSRNHYQIVSRWLYHVRGDRQLSSNMSLKCGCGVIFLWLLKRKNTTNFKVKSQNASFKQLQSSQKMWIKKRGFCVSFLSIREL